MGCHRAPSSQPSVAVTPSCAATTSKCAAKRSGAGMHDAWWMTTTLNPKDSVVEGIPAWKIDHSWSLASPITRALFPPGWERDAGSLTSDSAFRCEGDFNGDGRRDLAIAGVFRSKRGTSGGFLLILTRGSHARWEVAFLERHESAHNFSSVSCQGRSISWFFCLDCDAYVNVEWDGKRYRTRAPAFPGSD